MSKVNYVLIGLYFWGIGMSYALSDVPFGPKEAQINGSIKYSVIGKYNAQFQSFNGKITLDKSAKKIQSVYLEIDAASIQSDCRWCDNIVRSQQLLAVEKYPQIIFQSTEIIENKQGYMAKGTMDLHGIKREVSFPFDAVFLDNSHVLNVQGQWHIRRKDFKITWNALLDHGGILVGDHIAVDWKIQTDIK